MGVEKAICFLYGDYTKSFKELRWFVDFPLRLRILIVHVIWSVMRPDVSRDCLSGLQLARIKIDIVGIKIDSVGFKIDSVGIEIDSVWKCKLDSVWS
ncbi:hypothetical protein RHMOL_Rhmol09G0047100 [Rhododendron molle]|uniref:Uncharacterized protein n=1 Tax=Rhododendron molle TaxID=49168 RepID=A0ACC0MAW9_RHOML|nr:hypothetical protein RHMOL_Rhmol09G0047100 [Rhododendron molle]